MDRTLRRFGAGVVAIAVLVLPVSRAFATPEPTYLAIGDSLAYGMQVGKLKQEVAAGNVTAASFNTGYVDVLAAKLRTTTPALRVVDFGCPGETTASFINGPCGYVTTGAPFGNQPLPLHDSYTNAQLTTTLAYLAHHPEVTTITFDLGLNDLRAVEVACSTAADGSRCIDDGWSAARAGTERNIRDILGQIRAAAPTATIVVLGYYNWLAVTMPQTDRQVEDVNAILATATASIHGRFVNAFPAFNQTGDERSRLCELTLFCGTVPDVHPSNAGYRAIGNLLAAALEKSSSPK